MAIIYTKMNGKFGVSDRDFVFIRGIIEKNNKIYVISTSVEYEQCKPIKNVVRGDMVISGWILEKINSELTHGINIGQKKFFLIILIRIFFYYFCFY